MYVCIYDAYMYVCMYVFMYVVRRGLRSARSARPVMRTMRLVPGEAAASSHEGPPVAGAAGVAGEASTVGHSVDSEVEGMRRLRATKSHRSQARLHGFEPRHLFQGARKKDSRPMCRRVHLGFEPRSVDQRTWTKESPWLRATERVGPSFRQCSLQRECKNCAQIS